MKKIEISYKTIVFTVAFLGLVWLIIQLKDIIFLLFISFIVMAALRPYVDKLEKYRIPRPISILGVYFIVFGIIGYSFSSFIPVIITQTTIFINDLPKYEEALSNFIKIDFDFLINQIAPISQNLLRFSVNIFSNIFNIFTILIFAFYFLLERVRLMRAIRSMLDDSIADKIFLTVERVENNLGSWMRGEIALMLSIGVLTFIGLSFLQIEFALPLAIIAGFMEIIPIIGPVVSAIPAVLVALTISPLLALATTALYIVIQQLENNLIVPYVMNKAVGLSPLIVIVALMIGSKLAGTVGAIIAIPILISIRSILLSLYSKDASEN